MTQITQQWLKEENACRESYAWLSKQKNKDDIAIVKKLYKEKKYKWCLWLLHRKEPIIKSYIRILIIISYLFYVLSLYIISMDNPSAFAFAYVGALALVFGFAFVFAFAGALVFAYGFALGVAPLLTKIGCKITFKMSKRYKL